MLGAGVAAGSAGSDGSAGSEEVAWLPFDAWARKTSPSPQQHARALITTLSVLLPEHGLSALRLDEALEDRWLTREVWRALNLPDLAVVCDWAEVER